MLIGLGVAIATALALFARSIAVERRRSRLTLSRRRRDAANNEAWNSIFGQRRVPRLSDRSAGADGDGAA